MDQFNFKQWLIENKAGAYSKTSLNEALDAKKAFADDNENRGDMNEVNPAALGVGQAEADAEMQKQDDLNSDMVDNVSMDVMAEASTQTTDITVPEIEMTILGKDYLMDVEVEAEFHVEPGTAGSYHTGYDPEPADEAGVFFDGAKLEKITSLQVFDEEQDTFREITDPTAIKQIEGLIKADPKYSRQLSDTVGDSYEFEQFAQNYSGGDEDSYEPDMDETVGYAMITKPSDPAERGE